VVRERGVEAGKRDMVAGAWLWGHVLRHSMEVRQGRRRLGVGRCSVAQERDSGGAMGEREREKGDGGKEVYGVRFCESDGRGRHG